MRTWFITGISRGLGHALARAALASGDRVIGTTRGDAPAGLEGNLSVLRLDMRDAQLQADVVAQALAKAGRIDVLVNNAGFGLLGPVETSSETDLQDIFAVNLLAPIRIVREALPHLRAQVRPFMLPPRQGSKGSRPPSPPKWPPSASKSRPWRPDSSAPISFRQPRFGKLGQRRLTKP